MLMDHKSDCMCDKCINRRVLEKMLKEEADKLSADYMKRRSGLDRPANKKPIC